MHTFRNVLLRVIGASLFLWLFASTGAAAPTPTEIPATPADYRIVAHDLVVFQLYKEPDLKNAQRVTNTGEISVPLLGPVIVAGRTLREAEQEVQRRYIAGGFFVKPQVTLSVAEYGPRYVMVMGQVKNPDRVQLNLEVGTISLLEAVTRVGGLTRLAKANAVQITRRSDGREERFTVDLEAYLAGGPNAKAPDLQLQPGDIVFVPERAF